MNSEELRESYGYGVNVMTEDGVVRYAHKAKKKTAFEMVKEFHKTYGHPVADEPQFVEGDRLDLRLSLIEEEYKEVLEAIENGDLVNFAKELADLIYVVNGFALEAGIPLDAVVEEVHRSNMSKLGADGKPIYREDGKVLKGPNYTEADVAKVLGL